MIWKETICTSRNKEYEQLAASMSTTQLLASYSFAKGYSGTLYICAVAVSDTEKVVTHLPSVNESAGIELGGCLVQNN